MRPGPHSRRALAALVVLLGLPPGARGQEDAHSRTVVVRNGPLTLRALLWRPPGSGPFPAVLLNHGSGRSPEELARLGPYERQADMLGPVFARHGYVFLYLFRRGVGLSADQGANAVDLMNTEAAAHGQAAQNALQMRLLEERDMSDALSGLAFLRALPEVDPRRIAALGDSFGGSLTLLLAEREPDLRAVVVSACAGYSWDRSPELRSRLLAAAGRIAPPVFFMHAANDYSVAPGKALDARFRQLGKNSRLMIYPSIGRTAEEGHGLLYRAVSVWETDVFGFLDTHLRRTRN